MVRRCVQCNTPLDVGGFLCASCSARQSTSPPTPLTRTPEVGTPAAETPAPAEFPPSMQASGTRAGCAHCGAPFVEADYPTPLCTACRDTLSRRPIPLGIRAAAAAIALVVLLSFVRFPGAVRAGVAYARGQKAEAAGDNEKAAMQYLITTKQYPHSTLALARLGLSCYKAGDYDDAGAAFDELSGRKTDSALADEVNAAITDMNAKAEAADKAAAQQKVQDTTPIVLKAPAPAVDPVSPGTRVFSNVQPPGNPIPVGGFRPGDPRLRARFVPQPVAPGPMTSPNAPPNAGETGTGQPLPQAPPEPSSQTPPASSHP